jgi:hypothetical protein
MQTSATEAEQLSRALGLVRHPEGGWYRETWRAASTAGSTRAAATSILFLLGHGERSHLHRIDADELWLWQGGGAVHVHVLSPHGERSLLVVGPPGAVGAVPQAVVPAGAWFGAEPAPGSWTLVACVVAPGFEFSGFELATRAPLQAAFPQHADLIEAFTPAP